MIHRIRITKEHDIYKGKIAYVLEVIDQHSLSAYIVNVKGTVGKRCYQRDEFKFLKPVHRCKLRLALDEYVEVTKSKHY